MIKNIKTKFLISILVLMTIASTLISYNVYAGYLEGRNIDNSNSEISIELEQNKKVKLTLKDLNEKWELLCSQKGQHIPSEGSESNYILAFGTTYKTESPAYYYVKETKIAKPAAAYVLNETTSEENSSGTHYNNIQGAWWRLPDGQINSTKIHEDYGASLYNKAIAYQNFVKKIAKNESDVENTDTYKTLTHTFEDGTTASIKFPEINIKDKIKFNNLYVDENDGNKIKVNEKSEKVRVSFDDEKQQYIIGPLSISYFQDEKNGDKFGGLEGFQIYTNASENPLEKGKDWDFVWLEGQRKDDSSEYPNSEEVFYIAMNYIENATKITKINVDYKYLIVGGQYQLLYGNYDRYYWKLKSNTDENGTTTYNYEAKDQDLSLESQHLSLVNKATRWYETINIPLNGEDINFYEGYLEITKKAVDEQGKELTVEEIKEKFGEDQYFDFRVKITHSNGTVEYDTQTVKAGTTLRAGPYRWGNEEKTPTYEVEEISNMNESWKIKSIENEKGTLKNGKTISVVSENELENKHEQTISLTKKISGKASEEENFYFDVTVTMPDGTKKKSEAKITIPKGQESGNTWVSEKYIWYGNNKPEFEIVENMDKGDAAKYPNTSITPAKGKLDGSKATFDVNALNYYDDKDHKGILEIEKILENGQVTDDEFKFDVKVEGVSNTENGTDEFSVILKAGEKAGPFEYIWNGDKAPTFTVTETDSSEIKKVSIETIGGENVKKSGKTVTGQLSEKNDAKISAKFMNDMEKHSGKIKVYKEIYTTAKINKDTIASEGKIKFDIEIVIEGTFVYKGKTYQNSTAVITKSLPDNGNWSFETEDIEWYGSKAPTYTVSEKNLPLGWQCRTISYGDLENKSTDSEGHSLVDGKTVEATVTNDLPETEEIDLTFSMGGLVWVDKTLDEKNNADDGYYSAPNGVYDKGETLKENTEVTVYRVVFDNSGKEIGRTVAKAYKDINDNELQFPIITKSDGKWNVPRIKVPGLTEEEKANGCAVRYDVEFIYDGQTYEPTEFLSYKISGDVKTKNTGSNEQKSNEFINAKPAIKDQYSKDSMALSSPENASKIIAEVSGKTAIDSNGDTTGIATLADGTQVEITYSSDNAGSGYPTISKVNTLDKNGMVLDIFKAKANTSVGNLTFPVKADEYDGTSLTNVNTTIKEDGIHTTYKFLAVYNYCLNINLGLKERESVDIGLTKKLDNAKVVVKEKMYQYKYSGYYDLTQEKQGSLAKYICEGGEKTDITYQLGLYKSDYYYRAEMYQEGEDKTVYDALTDFYSTTLNKKLEDTELDVYLTYNIVLANNSAAYDVKINSIDDYFDSSFKLVTSDETKYLKTKTVGGKEEDVNGTETVAKASDYADKWAIKQTGITGSDKDAKGNNIVYNKMTASDLGIMLAPGETKNIVVTFKVEKEDSQEAKNAIILGQKCNVAEIGSYTSYLKGTTNYAGVIDRDSAPSNVNISAYNDKNWYEDDTFAAPRITVDFSENDRTINGEVWEDNSKDKNTENPGYNQQVGNGIKDSGEDEIENLTTELVEKVIIPNSDGTYTQYDYIWPTNKKLQQLNGKSIEELTGFDSTITTSRNGKYTFMSAPAGDYSVRFTYGDSRIESKDYSTSKYYNGQDYKSTKFNSILKDGDKVRPDSYLNIDEINNQEKVQNAAIDNEVKRLEIVEKSRTINYENSSEMFNLANNADIEWNNKYSMYAESPKLDMNIELSTYGKDKYTYDVKNVNFGLEERPITQLTLDKQIEEIILTTSDGNTIMDAKYNINYEVQDNGEIKANVELDSANSYGIDNLQALNRDQATNQGFRYINVDSTILEGTTVTVRYKFTVLNTGEVDRTGELANENIDFAKACRDLNNDFAKFTKVGNSLKNDKTLGQYVGSIYYYGDKGDQSDKVVTSTVRQLIDYIDNDAQFSGMMNSTTDTSWSNITVQELLDGKMIDSSIIDETTNTILDEHGVQYETENRNNLVVSVDSKDANSSLNNKGFIVELQPFESAKNTNNVYSASMYLTTTRYVGADSDDLQLDNIAEIIRYENRVGRRDELTVAGNQNPAKALEEVSPGEKLTSDGTLSDTLKYERDTSATEVITLSPPTGSGLNIWRLQVLASITAGLVIIVGGIVLIKKKVLK